MKTIYVSQKNNRSWSTSPEAFDGWTYPVIVPDNFMGGAMTYDRFSENSFLIPFMFVLMMMMFSMLKLSENS